MTAIMNGIPIWLSAYWVSVTLVRLVISIFAVFVWGRRVSIKKLSAKALGIGLTSIVLAVWVLLTFYLGRINFFRIDENTALPPPIAVGALLPIFIGYVAFQYWDTFRRIIFNIPQHWLIGLQAYRITGGVFLILYAQGLIPGVFGLVAGIGDFVTGLTAIAVAYFCYKQTSWSRKVAIGWNYIGLVELIILIPFGLLSSPSSIQVLALDAPNYLTSIWPSVLAPTFHVPLGILLHIYSLACFRHQGKATIKSSSPSAAWQLMLFSAVAVSAYVALFYIATPLLTTKATAFQVHPRLQAVLTTMPIGLYTHVILSMLALLLGPFQFLKSLRSKHPNIHRWTGRVYLFGGILMGGLGGLYLAQFSFAGLASRLGFSLQAMLLLFTGYMAFSNIRRGRIQSHRKWMIRNYALIFGAVTLRIYIRGFFAMGLELPDFHALNAWLCWVPNLLFAEWLIYRLRSRPDGKQEITEPLDAQIAAQT